MIEFDAIPIRSAEAGFKSGKPDVALIRLVARGRRWYEPLTCSEMPALRAIANAEGLARGAVPFLFSA